MVVTDTISDMLTTIRNGLLLSKEFVKTPSSKIKLNLLKILQEEGFIKSFTTLTSLAANNKSTKTGTP